MKLAMTWRGARFGYLLLLLLLHQTERQSLVKVGGAYCRSFWHMTLTMAAIGSFWTWRTVWCTRRCREAAARVPRPEIPRCSPLSRTVPKM
ncbi:hypothetical protein CICLE_v10027264mg [Citrus x clementina]|uniref:Secreted protein n=1 Tax=Citrus clementina TaxID=85681 RepID=V4SP80_CITCL|nr:hypothetical protein CICLE_v10027264mg [Citrus x clementina]